MSASIAATRHTPRFLVPETVQTSAMDCGPAALKCLLEGFGISASYGRLREACQTDVDGTSINTIEDVATQLGLHATQMMAPADHLFLPSAQLLPALVVTVLPNGFNHFVVVWRVHGPIVQIMDPATGRRWSTKERFLREVYRYTVPFSATNWRAWAAGDGFVTPLQQRLDRLSIPAPAIDRLLDHALGDPNWRSMAALDAATRMVTSLRQAGGIEHRQQATQLVEEFFRRACEVEQSEQPFIPESFWTVRPLPGVSSSASDTDALLIMRGAVLLSITGVQDDFSYLSSSNAESPADNKSVGAATEPSPAQLGSHADEIEAAQDAVQGQNSILRAVLTEATQRPEWELVNALRRDGLVTPLLLGIATIVAALNVTVEVAFLRGLMVVAADPRLGLWHLFLGVGLLLFVILGLALEWPLATGALRMGRRLESRIRILFLEKIPRLSDRYFHSRLISDMAQRAHGLNQLHSLPDLVLRFLRLAIQLIFTTAGIIWLYPASAPIALCALCCAIAGALLLQPIQSERDMRVRTHSGALSRFYLDALIGLLPIRTHSAERMVRREHEILLVAWARESLALARVETFQQLLVSTLNIGFVIWIVISYIAGRGEASALLLLLYWALNMPALGQALAVSARQYPLIRNNMARILEPLGAPDEQGPGNPRDQVATQDKAETKPLQQSETSDTPAMGAEAHTVEADSGAAITLDAVSVQAGGHLILEDITLAIQPGEHVAIVGESGAGKSTLVGLLLGWLRPAHGRIRIDGKILDGTNLQQLRREIAWVDPSIQLWNRSLMENLRYGNTTEPSLGAEAPIGQALEEADLYALLERLPNGLQTRLGEGGNLVSGGEGQRVRLGRAFLRSNVRLAILDEPFRGLDRTQRRQLLQNARQHWQNATLLCITHDIAETTNFTRVLVVQNGRLVEDGTPQVLLAKADSRYQALVAADQQVHQQRWAATSWRRLWLANGQLSNPPDFSTDSTEGETTPRTGKRMFSRDTQPTTTSDSRRVEPGHELQQIHGIGPVWASRLASVGLHTIAELATVDAAALSALLVENGYRPPARLTTWIADAHKVSEERRQ